MYWNLSTRFCVSCCIDRQAFSPCFLGAVGAVWLALGWVWEVRLRVVYRGWGRGGGGRGRGGCAGVLDTATAGATVSLWLAGGSHPITAGRAVCTWWWMGEIGRKVEGESHTHYIRWQLMILVGVFRHFYLWISLIGSSCSHTTGVQVCVADSVAGAEAGGAWVTVLGLGGANIQAAHFTVGTVHHLHKLTTPKAESVHAHQWWLLENQSSKQTIPQQTLLLQQPRQKHA